MNETRIKELLTSMPKATMIAATKYFDSQQMRTLFGYGVHHFGENKVQDLLKKQNDLSDLSITWHFIGHLQSNKVKMMINQIDVLHSLDSLPLARQIERYRIHPLPCFVEVNISEETTKYGLHPKDVVKLIQDLQECATIRVIGLMGMAEETKEESVIRSQFQILLDLQAQIQALQLVNAPCESLSMGMSNDYPIAYDMGSTHVRLGRILL